MLPNPHNPTPADCPAPLLIACSSALLPIGLFAAGAHVWRLLEDDGFVVIEEDSVFNVQANGAGEDHFFQGAPLFHQIFNGIAMREAADALFDDGAVVEDCGDIVRGGADEFYAARISLVMGFRTDKGGQKRVMNVDDGHRILVDEVRRKHLHVACEYNGVDAVGG